jgi:hypothetical protein
MKEIHIDFAFNITVEQLERLTDAEEGNPFRWADVVPHSCVLHKRLIHDTEQCRRRIRDHPDIFTALINAYVQDALGMADDCDEE